MQRHNVNVLLSNSTFFIFAVLVVWGTEAAEALSPLPVLNKITCKMIWVKITKWKVILNQDHFATDLRSKIKQTHWCYIQPYNAYTVKYNSKHGIYLNSSRPFKSCQFRVSREKEIHFQHKQALKSCISESLFLRGVAIKPPILNSRSTGTEDGSWCYISERLP